jgi:hypothetical protein
MILGRVVARETCSTEVKVILALPSAQSAVSAFGFGNEAAGVIYFFDTESRDLLHQGLIIRIRQGSNNDLTVKWRPPDGSAAGERAQLREQFPCEVDRTPTADIESYAIGRQYKAAKLPEFGTDVYGLLSDSQKQLLKDARVAVDWTRVVRVATVNSTKWSTSRRSPYGKLALELWAWPAGKIIEVSAKPTGVQYESKPLHLEALALAETTREVAMTTSGRRMRQGPFVRCADRRSDGSRPWHIRCCSSSRWSGAPTSARKNTARASPTASC